jgi:hypothetical protein
LPALSRFIQAALPGRREPANLEDRISVRAFSACGAPTRFGAKCRFRRTWSSCAAVGLFERPVACLGAAAWVTKRICDPENLLFSGRLNRDLDALSLREFFLVRVEGQELFGSLRDRGGNMQDVKRTMPLFRRVHAREPFGFAHDVRHVANF